MHGGIGPLSVPAQRAHIVTYILIASYSYDSRRRCVKCGDTQAKMLATPNFRPQMRSPSRGWL